MKALWKLLGLMATARAARKGPGALVKLQARRAGIRQVRRWTR